MYMIKSQESSGANGVVGMDCALDISGGVAHRDISRWPQEFVACGPQYFVGRRPLCGELCWVQKLHKHGVLCRVMKFKVPVGPAEGHF